MDVAEYRHVRDSARGRLVERAQVVEIEEVGVGGSGEIQLPHPGSDLELVGAFVEGGQDRVLGSGAVLVRAVHGRGPGGALEAERVPAAKRRGEVHRSQVEPGVEALGECVLAEVGPRAGRTETSKSLLSNSRASARQTWAEPPRG